MDTGSSHMANVKGKVLREWVRGPQVSTKACLDLGQYPKEKEVEKKEEGEWVFE